MTSVIDARATAAALKRRAAHEALIAGAPAGSRRRRSRVLDWLLSEIAHGGDLDEVLRLARDLNARAGR